MKVLFSETDQYDWCLPICNFWSLQIQEGRPQWCHVPIRRQNLPKCIHMISSVMISLKMQFLWMIRTHKTYNSFLGEVPRYGVPVWQQEGKLRCKTNLVEAFKTNQMWMGGGQENVSSNLPAPTPPCPWSQYTWPIPGFGMHNMDAQQCGLRQRGASTRNMSQGGMRTWIPYPGNPSALELSLVFQNSAGDYTTLYIDILSWRSTGPTSRLFTMAYHLQRSQRFENH